MSNYNKIIPTLAGSNLLVESIKSKKPLIFTRIALGDGTLTENESIEGLTALKHTMAQNSVQSVNSRGNGEIDVVATISNASVTSGFYARELGVFAKVGDTGVEKLFAYTNAGAQASYTPAGTSLDEKLITVTFYVGNDVNVKINLNSQLYITKAALDEHNSSANAHDNRFAKYLPLVGGTLTGDLNFSNGTWAIFENNGNKGAIRMLQNGTMDVGVNSQGAALNINLCSNNRPGWYSPAGGNKQIAIVEEVDAAKNSLTSAMNKYLPLAGGTVTGNIKVNNAVVGFNNGNNDYDTKIRIASNGNFDIGVTEDSNNKNATNQLLLHSQNRPKWYNSVDGNKTLAIVDEIDAAKNSLTTAMANYLPLAGGTVTGAIDFKRGELKGKIALKPNGNLDFGSLDTKCSVLNSKERPLWYTGDSRGGMLALTKDIVPDPTQCVNLYDAKSEGYQTGRERDTFNLKTPYTDYDFLIIVLSDDGGQFLGISQINVSWLEKVRKMSVGTGLDVINIATVGSFYWGINNKSTPTKMITYDGYENSHLWEVWGYKITR